MATSDKSEINYLPRSGEILFTRKSRTFLITKDLTDGYEIIQKEKTDKPTLRLDTVFVFSEYRRWKRDKERRSL